MTDPKDFASAPDVMKKHLETRDRILAAAGYPQTRATIEEIRALLSLSDVEIERVDPSLVRHLAQRVIDLEQTAMVLEPGSKAWATLERAVGLGAVRLRDKRATGADRESFFVDVLVTDQDPDDPFAAHAETLAAALERATAKARAFYTREQVKLEAVLRLLRPDLEMPFVVDAPIVLGARAQKMIADAEAEIGRESVAESGVGNESEDRS